MPPFLNSWFMTNNAYITAFYSFLAALYAWNGNSFYFFRFIKSATNWLL